MMRWPGTVGSPPRAWGQRPLARNAAPNGRFTPTGVGTTISGAPWTTPGAVHPHGRGDNFPLSGPLGVGGGSPPRAWGQQTDAAEIEDPGRFTPTGVGTTRFRWRSLKIAPVHPHGRGDNAACPPSPDPTAVHPHGRGDNAQVGFFQAAIGGSPPRAWGQPISAFPDVRSSRFTPTGVGTTGLAACFRAISAVHPHGRGDNGIPDIQFPFSFGSPPRAWGQRGLCLSTGGSHRFTPPGVGTTISAP